MRTFTRFVALMLVPGCGDARPDQDASTPSRDAAHEEAGAPDAADVGFERDAGQEDATHDDARAEMPDAAASPDASSSDAGMLGAWSEGFSLPPPDGRDSFAQFGGAVAIADGAQRVAVGDIGSGQVTVYEPIRDTWVRVDVLDAPVGTFSFGWDIDLDADGTTLVVSAPPGRVVFVYEHTATGWSAPAELRLAGDVSGFGASVSLTDDGRRVVVGAASPAPSQGVFVFDRLGDVWAGPSALALSPGAVEAGGHVAIDASGQRLIAADPGRSVRAGSAALYVRSASAWGSPQALDLPPGTISVFDVAMSDDGTATAVSDVYVGLGSVSVYQLTGGTWARETLSAPPGAASFGYTLALAASGASLWSGDVQGSAGGGHVTEHVRDASGWRYSQTLPTPLGSRDFGSALDVTPDGRVLVASDVNGGIGDRGTAYVFRR